jgi:hypothetical protein
MNQDRVNKLGAEHYGPMYAPHGIAPEVLADAKKIAFEEKARGETIRSVRTRIHEMLQSRVEVPDPPIAAATAAEARLKLEEHHDHQTAHFQALWKLADALAAAVTS